MSASSIRGTAFELLNVAAGVGVATVGLKAFLLPNGFLDGGVTGVGILLELLLGWPLSVTLPLLSVPFLVVAYYTLSRRIVYKSILSIVSLAVALEFVDFTVVTDDKLLIALFGGLCLGLGIGLTVRNGAVLDGSEVLGIFVNDRFGISIGKVILGFNIVLFAVTALLLSVEVALYSILTYLVTAEVTDVVVRGLEDFIGVTIVSRHSEDIQRAILTDLGAGMTLYDGRGGYGTLGHSDPQQIIHTVLNRIDIRRLYRIVDEIDPAAFIIEFDVNHVRGGVLRRYLSRAKDRKLPQGDLFASAKRPPLH